MAQVKGIGLQVRVWQTPRLIEFHHFFVIINKGNACFYLDNIIQIVWSIIEIVRILLFFWG